MKTRLLSMLLSLCMALTMFPAGAFAAQPEQEQLYAQMLELGLVDGDGALIEDNSFTVEDGTRLSSLAELTDWLCQTRVPVYLTIDLDCLDPSAFPGTGTPEAGGVSFLQLLQAIRTVTKANIVGADVNELAPMLDQSGVSTATACKVLRELLLALEK